jgi:hypothetical protein
MPVDVHINVVVLSLASLLRDVAQIALTVAVIDLCRFLRVAIPLRRELQHNPAEKSENLQEFMKAARAYRSSLGLLLVWVLLLGVFVALIYKHTPWFAYILCIDVAGCFLGALLMGLASGLKPFVLNAYMDLGDRGYAVARFFRYHFNRLKGN